MNRVQCSQDGAPRCGVKETGRECLPGGLRVQELNTASQLTLKGLELHLDHPCHRP